MDLRARLRARGECVTGLGKLRCSLSLGTKRGVGGLSRAMEGPVMDERRKPEIDCNDAPAAVRNGHAGLPDLRRINEPQMR